MTFSMKSLCTSFLAGSVFNSVNDGRTLSTIWISKLSSRISLINSLAKVLPQKISGIFIVCRNFG